MGHSRCWRVIITLLTIVTWYYPCAAAPDKEQILRMLQQFDAVYTENGFTVEGTTTEKASKEDQPGQPDVTRNWKMTIQGKRAAATYEVVGPIEGIYFVEPGSSPMADHDPDGNTIVGVLTKREVYCDSQRSNMYTEHTVHRIGPDNSVLEKAIARDATVSGPGLTGVGRYIKEGLWSVGRGFSQFIDEITGVEELANGKIRVVAKGRQSDVYYGRWELVIDTEAAWMVRHAKFFHKDYPDVIDCESVNSGLIWNGSLAMPTKTAINYGGPIDQESDTLKVEFAGISSGPDEKLIERLQSGTKPPFDDDTTVMVDRANGPIWIDGRDVQRIINNEKFSSINTEVPPDANTNENSNIETNEPNTQFPISQKANRQHPPLGTQWYILPPWAAYIILVSALVGVIVLVSKKLVKGHKQA
jgi:hypothetical protein